jgi:hypothetical protein
MWWRRKALARLHGELNTLALFDRVYDYTQDHALADSRAHALRQIRHTQIVAQIKELNTSKAEYWNRGRISSAILLLCAGGYATLRYLLK